MPAADQTWTTRRLLGWMRDAFTQKDLDSPGLCAEMLMAHVLGTDRLKLYTDLDRPASPLERETLRDLVRRAIAHEPIQYLVGEAWFFGLRLAVDRRALIPRPSTETLVQCVLDHSSGTPGFGPDSGVLIAEIGVGSGCVLCALGSRLATARLIGTDISPDALALARENLTTHKLIDRTDLLKGDLLAPLAEHPTAKARNTLHYLVSNPPYIPDDEWRDVEPNVKDHEPHTALRGGTDGMDFVRPLLENGAARVRSGGLVVIEVAAARAEQSAEIARGTDTYSDVRILKDIDGLPRIVRAVVK